MLALILMFATAIAYTWMCFDIGRRSVLGGVLTFVLVLPAVYFLLRGWRDRRYDIRSPFFASLGGFALIACLAVLAPTSGEEAPNQSTSKTINLRG